MSTVAEIRQETERKMQRSVEALKSDLVKLRTGRASTGILEHITHEYYGSMMPITQVANLGVADARTLTVQPWDRKMVKVLAKTILSADLGLNPAVNGDVIRVPIPPLTEERRKELCKIVRGEGEDAKVAIRNLRRDANESVKKLEKAKEISEDDSTGAQKDIQKVTDKYIAEVDDLVSKKEKEVMTV